LRATSNLAEGLIAEDSEDALEVREFAILSYRVGQLWVKPKQDFLLPMRDKISPI